MYTKQEIRGKMLEMLRQHTQEERRRKGNLIKEKLFALTEFVSARFVMFYVSKDGEVETDSMIRRALAIGKKVAVPITMVEERKIVASQVIDVDKELSPGPFGILQPSEPFIRHIPPGELDLVVVPGVAFDKAGNRLGRGAGYYDRFLKNLSGRIPLIGIAFDFQLLDELPVSLHDIPVNKVITN
jgi:5-formyltetrahydrofolate cyclo-ligase